MAAKSSVPVQASDVDASAARAAYESLRAEREALPRQGLLPIRIDVQAAAAVAHSIAVRDADPERRQAFERLAKAELFDIGALDILGSAALAAWHARQQQQLASGVASGASVPVSVVTNAREVRRRMLRLLEYYFDDDVEVGPQLAVVRSGRGHQDLANDLEVVADLYEDASIRRRGACRRSTTRRSRTS
jgi:hypothetical protein